MKFKFNPIAILYILLVYLELATDRQHLYPVTYMTKYYIGILIIVLFVLLLVGRGKLIFVNKKLLYLAKILAIPTIVLFLYSVLLDVMNPVEFNGYFSRLSSTTIFGLLAIFQAIVVFQFFGQKVVDYTFTAISLSYLTSVIVAFRQGGLSQFILILTDDSFNGSVLEMHEVAPITALFILYYLYKYFIKENSFSSVFYNILIALIILFLSLKRIVLLSVLIIIPVFLVIYWYDKKVSKLGKERKILSLLNIFSLIFITGIFLYVYSVKSDFIYTFIQEHNINSMARTDLWKGVESTYNFAPIFMGRGIGFVTKWMDNNWMTLNINGLTGTMGIHNDILKYYIEIGFVGLFIYFYTLLYRNAKRIFVKIGHKESFIYFVLIMFQMLIWFTDNISIYHNFLWILNLLLFSLTNSDTELENLDFKNF
ncbi:TPA: O-antigen ligase family protein [Streptococcus pneumoniae]|nr:O-antigen ligase family protein [Streptococcus pneumoniae]